MSTEPEKLRWGLIGASDIAATRMIPAINAQPDSVVHSVVSGNADHAKSYAKKNSIPQVHDNLDTFLADPALDIVYISSTNEKHREQALASIRAHKPVLCEKPLALSLTGAREMVSAAAQASIPFGTNHHLRCASTHRTLRRLVQEGVIGQPLAARVFHAVYLPPRLQGWRLDNPAAGAGVTLDITVHDADTLHFALGLRAQEVIAQSLSQGLGQGGVEDTIMGVIRFEGNILAQFHDSFTIGHASTGFEIHGTEGSLLATDVMTQEPIGRVVLRRGTEEIEIDPGSREDLYSFAVRHFNAAARGDGHPAATGDDGIRSLAVALAVIESVKTGKRTKVQYEA
ncbi:MAG TPA: Gfo/Idh/MocA family oxidoreductase [Chthoniobacterales bacterium]|nr:Gfo/Idh/MocA family oxidoreductase [Chthoniobacterales bacterium]